MNMSFFLVKVECMELLSTL